MPLHRPDIQGDGPRDCGMFFLDVVGAYRRGQVQVQWSPTRRSTNDELERLIDQAWQLATWQAKKNGQNLYDGDLCRLIEYQAEGDQLGLTLGKVSYKEFVGTNQTQAYVRYLHGPEVLADPLGVSSALITDDGFILLGRRSERVMQYGGRIHPIGGIVEPPDKPGDPPDPFDAMLAEVLEEIRVPSENVRDFTLLGLVRDKNTVQPELIFDMRLDMEAATVCRSAVSAIDADEHTEIIPVRDHPAAVVTFLQQKFGELTPVSLATLLLHGLQHWGSGWFAGARGYLRSVI
jgi:8-oxo-dGTP pyrophosphatase MutT (NUDIX family)